MQSKLLETTFNIKPPESKADGALQSQALHAMQTAAVDNPYQNISTYGHFYGTLSWQGDVGQAVEEEKVAEPFVDFHADLNQGATDESNFQ